MEVESSADQEVNVRSPGPPKRLVFCFDGTWNTLDARCPTNVVLTAETVLPMAPDGKAQAIFYDEGVGTGKSEHLGGGMFGWGLVDRLGDAYRFLTFNYTPGDEIYVFGFSRGAFTARSFVGMLRNCGIVARTQAARIGDAIDWYRERTSSKGPNSLPTRQFRAEISPTVCVDEGEDAWRQANIRGYAPGDAPLLNLRYLGVWDTVGALGVPTRYRLLQFFNRKYRFHDTNLSSMVRSGRHAVAIDERRQDFTPTLWSNIDELNREARADPDSPLAPFQERWFPGVHCGVGGGGDFRGLSDQSLAWVWDGAQKAGLALDTSVGSKVFELAPDPCSPLSPFDEDNFGLWQRAKSSVLDLMWRRGDRTGPTVFRNVSPSARRRWKMNPAELPEHTAYRPAPLKAFEADLNALPDIPPPPEAGTYKIVRVAPGETLGRIAKRELGDSERWKEIFEINRDELDDPDHIFIGMPLRIPTSA
jgi:uncharacterized protein (DUF2235 family)